LGLRFASIERCFPSMLEERSGVIIHITSIQSRLPDGALLIGSPDDRAIDAIGARVLPLLHQVETDK
jgi:hypothetical protein